MSSDDKIVSVQFDNAAFQAKMAQTIASLDKLSASLNAANSNHGLEHLQQTANNFKMEGIAASIESVNTKFLAMATIGITALTRIADQAITAGARFLKSFTFAPIMDGFREFETNANSIQTILANTASKGTDLAQVSAALQKLNEYSDKTIYNFGQMAKNIGTFTAAGVDLDTSVNSIKGIANLAAVSGSSAEQASGAMYQLSQAIAAGSLKLIDWNSVVNSGMGGEVFKNALFETGKAMKSLTGVPIGQTFKDWEKANGSFRESLEQGWVTSDVLTTTLSAFTGDLTDAQLKAKGFTDSQIVNIKKMAATATAAATEVKTFTQLVSTVKEAIGTGWADTFRIIVGDFEEAKALFSGIYNSINGFVSKVSDARNNMLKGWKDLGGRKELLDALGTAFWALARPLVAIGRGFREIFPPMTAQRLFELTKGFQAFVESLYITTETMDKLKRVFAGVFAIVEIGWTVFKELFSLFKDLVKSLIPAGSGLLDFSASAGDMAVNLNKALVEGGAIHRFFERIRDVIAKPIAYFQAFTEKVRELFSVNVESSDIEKALGRIESRADHISGVWDAITDRLDGFLRVLRQAASLIGDWFSELGRRIADAFHPGDFNAAVDALNVGLLGGILYTLKRFVEQGIKLNPGGLVNELKTTFFELNNKLKLMQTQIKADALLKIAGALALLTVSVVALSLIDSGALTKALTAMAVGFGQLVATMALLDKAVTDVKGATKLAIISGALIAMAAAMDILVVAIAVLGNMDPAALARGLAGIAAALALMIVTTTLLSTNSKGLIAAGLAMAEISTGLTILAGAVKLFSMMEPGELARGLAAIAAGLLIIVTAMNFMPPSSVLSGLGFVAVATGLVILSQAVSLFGNLEWGVIGKGLVGITGALLAIALAMNLMPVTLPITAAGLVLVSGALLVMAKAIGMLGGMEMGNLAKGVGALAATLLILAVGTNAMNTALPGAAAMVVVAGALTVLAGVIKVLGDMDIKTLAIALGAIAAVFLVLGGAALLLQPVVPALMGIGIALGLIGLGFSGFGLGVMLVAKAFEILAKSGAAGAKALVEIMKIFATAKVVLIEAFANVVIGFAQTILKAMPLLMRLIEAFLLQFLETIIKVTPKIAEAFQTIVLEGLKLIRKLYPEILKTGIDLLLTFLRGIRDNIGDILEASIEIIEAFVNGLTDNMSRIISAGTDIMLAFLTELGAHVTEILDAGAQILANILLGIANNILTIVDTVGTIISEFLKALGDQGQKIIDGGIAMVNKLIEGLKKLGAKSKEWIDAGVSIASYFLDAVADGIVSLTDKVARVVINFMNEMAETIRRNGPNMRGAAVNLATALIDGITFGVSSEAGRALDAIENLAKSVLKKLTHFWEIFSPSHVTTRYGRYLVQGVANGLRDTAPAEDGAGYLASKVSNRLKSHLEKMHDQMASMSEFNPVITPVLDLSQVQKGAKGMDALMKAASINPAYSEAQARLIAFTNRQNGSDSGFDSSSEPKELVFTQHNYSPKALSTKEIYRNTKSQITLAKEELGIK